MPEFNTAFLLQPILNCLNTFPFHFPEIIQKPGFSIRLKELSVVKPTAWKMLGSMVLTVSGNTTLQPISERLFTGRSILIKTLKFRRSEEHTSELQSRPHLVCRL